MRSNFSYIALSLAEFLEHFSAIFADVMGVPIRHDDGSGKTPKAQWRARFPQACHHLKK